MRSRLPRRSSRGVPARKRSTDWWNTLVDGSVPPLMFDQDWVIPPLGDGNFFPTAEALSHLTLVRSILSYSFTCTTPVGTGSIGWLGLIMSAEDPTTGNPTNRYEPGNDPDVEWVIRVPFIVRNDSTTPEYSDLNVIDADRLFVESRAQRKCMDGQGLIWVVSWTPLFGATAPSSLGFILDVRALVKNEP